MDADALYRLPPEEFTAARDAAAKAAKAGGDAEEAKELKALRKPSVAAWLVNRLMTEQRDLVEQLLDLGPALAAAQAEGPGDELRSLGAQRRELVDAVTSQAVALADRAVTAAVREEVASTLETALADPGAAEAVRSGRLVRALSYAGFGGVDLDGAVATTSAPRRTTPKPKKEQRDGSAEQVAAAEAAALQAAGRLDDAVRECERLERARQEAEQQEAQAEQEVERARQALAAAERDAKATSAARKAAAHACDEAVKAVRRAQQAEEQARTALDRLRRGDVSGG